MTTPFRRRREASSAPIRRLRPALVLLLAALLAPACAPSPPPPRARSIAARLAEKLPVVTPLVRTRSDEQRRFRDAPIYIDGRRAGVIRPLEVPSSLRPRMRIRPPAPPAPRYSIAEYIAATGGDLAKVREVHLLGGRGRASIVPGDELRKHRDDLLIVFSGGDRGKPRIGWPTTGIRVSSSIDIVQAILVYAEKDPPRFNEKKAFFHFGDDRPIEGVPYAPAEEVKGTRFYVDGSLAGWMKRKTLPSSVILPGAGVDSGLFSLRAFVELLGVDPRKVKAIELVQDDDAVARLDGRALTAEPPLAFKLPRRNQGNLVLLLPRSAFADPPADLPETVPIRVSAVQLFDRLAPPKRTYAKVRDLIEPEGGRDKPSGPEAGSSSDQGDP